MLGGQPQSERQKWLASRTPWGTERTCAIARPRFETTQREMKLRCGGALGSDLRSGPSALVALNSRPLFSLPRWLAALNLKNRPRPRPRSHFTSCLCCDAGSSKANIDHPNSSNRVRGRFAIFGAASQRDNENKILVLIRITVQGQGFGLVPAQELRLSPAFASVEVFAADRSCLCCREHGQISQRHTKSVEGCFHSH